MRTRRRAGGENGTRGDIPGFRVLVDRIRDNAPLNIPHHAGQFLREKQ